MAVCRCLARLSHVLLRHRHQRACGRLTSDRNSFTHPTTDAAPERTDAYAFSHPGADVDAYPFADRHGHADRDTSGVRGEQSNDEIRI